MTVFFMLCICCMGCDQRNSSSPNSPNSSFITSSVDEDNSGEKYFMRLRAISNAYDFYKWDIATKQWVKSITFTDSVYGTGYEFFVDQLNPTAQYFVLYEAYVKRLVHVDALTAKVTTQNMAGNYSIISADEFAVYQTGNQVWTYSTSKGAMTYLHNLPSLAAVNASLSLNIVDVAQYQMLCTPELVYKQWDRKTHYCIMANAIGYPSAPPIGFSNNHVYEFNVVVNPNGSFSYQLLRQHLRQTAMLLYEHYTYPSRVELRKRYPMFLGYLGDNYSAPSFNLETSPSADKQGNLHYFFQSSTPTKTTLSYSFITQANPTIDLYTQVLP